MVLCIGFEVINVNGGQSRDEQLKLLLIEDGDEPLGDDVIEALKERIKLLANRSSHLFHTYKFNILLLVLFSHRNVASIRFEVADFRLAKLLEL